MVAAIRALVSLDLPSVIADISTAGNSAQCCGAGCLTSDVEGFGCLLTALPNAEAEPIVGLPSLGPRAVRPCWSPRIAEPILAAIAASSGEWLTAGAVAE